MSIHTIVDLNLKYEICKWWLATAAVDCVSLNTCMHSGEGIIYAWLIETFIAFFFAYTTSQFVEKEEIVCTDRWVKGMSLWKKKTFCQFHNHTNLVLITIHPTWRNQETIYRIGVQWQLLRLSIFYTEVSRDFLKWFSKVFNLFKLGEIKKLVVNVFWYLIMCNHSYRFIHNKMIWIVSCFFFESLEN